MRVPLTALFLAFGVIAGFSVAGAQTQLQVRPPVVRAMTCATTTRDCDRDGHERREVGGDDCDDRDALRFPGNTEVTDVNGRDEDCDATTFGDRDADGDGFVDFQSVNIIDGQRVSGGDDCNDNDARIRPSAQELPNRLDDDCNGVIDDLAGAWWTPN